MVADDQAVQGAKASAAIILILLSWCNPQIARFMGPTWGPPGSGHPQVGPMLAPWTLLSGSSFSIRGGNLSASSSICGILFTKLGNTGMNVYLHILEWYSVNSLKPSGGHHRPRGKTTTGSALDGAVFDIAQILAYLVHNMSRSQLYLGFGHFGWLPSFFSQ